MKHWLKLARRLGLLLLTVMALLGGIITWNYLQLTSRQLPAAEIPHVDLDSQALLSKFRRAVQIPTISIPYAQLQDDSPLHQFRAFLEQEFPRLHESPFVRRTGADFGDELNPSVLLEWPGKDETLPAVLLMAHMDVVPAESKSNVAWSHAPFSGHLDNSYLWGRGTLDCKHGVMAILEAVDLLAEQGFQPNRTLFVAIGHDEELGGMDGNAKIAEWFRSHGRRLHLILDEGGCIFTEFPGLDKPAALIGVAEKGYVNVQLDVDMEADQAGHSSMPPAETSISIVSKAVHRIQAAPLPAVIDEGLKRTLLHLGPEMPSLLNRIAISNLWLFGPLVKRGLAATPSGNALLRTTAAATLIEGGERENVLPLHAAATLNFRLKPGDSVEDVVAYIRRTIDDPRVKVTPLTPYRNASPISASDTESFKALHHTIRAVYPDVVVAPFVLVGGTDSSHYIDLCENIYRFIPTRLAEADMKRFHGIDERISVEDYFKIVRFFHRFVLAAAGE